MRIPDNEMQALFDWSTTELERIEKEFPYVPGELDGGGVVAQKEHFAEYNKRLLALKARYETEPIVKAQTFDQLRQTAASQ